MSVYFDDMPLVKDPNPLPCGCCIVGVSGFNRDEIVYRNLSTSFCNIHAAAPELLAALENFVLTSNRAGYEFDTNEPELWAKIVSAIAKAKG